MCILCFDCLYPLALGEMAVSHSLFILSQQSWFSRAMVLLTDVCMTLRWVLRLKCKDYLETVYFFKKKERGKKENWERNELSYETIKPVKADWITQPKCGVRLLCEIFPSFQRLWIFSSFWKFLFQRAKIRYFEKNNPVCSAYLCCVGNWWNNFWFWSVLMYFLCLGQDLIHDFCQGHFSKQHS